MIAAVLEQPGKLTLTQRPAPACPDIGVVVRVQACGICASDARMVERGHPALVYPRIPGHEIAGVVVETRDSTWQEGDRVQVAPGLRCGLCQHCREGRDQRCLEREIFGFSRDGGFAGRLAVPTAGPLSGGLNALGPATGADLATLIEPLACCLNCQDSLALGAGDTVLIIGGGALGLLHLVLAKTRTAATVTVAEPLAHRRRTALGLGADLALAPENTAGLAEAAAGADVLILAAGQVPLSPEVLAALGRGVRIGLFCGPGQDHGFDPAWIHYNEITLAGTYGCGAGHNRRAAAIVDRHAGLLRQLITCRVGLAQIGQGLAHTGACTGIKAIVEVEDE